MSNKSIQHRVSAFIYSLYNWLYTLIHLNYHFMFCNTDTQIQTQTQHQYNKHAATQKEEQEITSTTHTLTDVVTSTNNTAASVSPSLLCLSSSFPAHLYRNTDLCESFLQNYYGGAHQLKEEQVKFIRHIFYQTCINECHAAIDSSLLFKFLPQSQYTLHIKQNILKMSVEAGEKSLQRLEKEYGIHRKEITHLIFGTMTGSISAPSMDIHLVSSLHLSPSTKRLNVESMGCLTGFRVVGLAGEIARQEGQQNMVLVITCDIRSALGNKLTPWSSSSTPNQELNRSNVIVSSLFRDGCAAAIISGRKLTKVNNNSNRGIIVAAVAIESPNSLNGAAIVPILPSPSSSSASASSCSSSSISSSSSSSDSSMFQLLDHLSYLVPDSIHHAWLREGDDSSQELFLGKELPLCIETHIASLIEPLLQKHSIPSINQCLFAVHTGGPRVIKSFTRALNLHPLQLLASWYVMIQKGNLSGSSNLMVVKYWEQILMKQQQQKQKEQEEDDGMSVEHILQIFDTHYHPDIQILGKQIKQKVIELTNQNDTNTTMTASASSSSSSSSTSHTNLFRHYTHMIGVSFGPGVGVEIVLLKLNHNQ